MLLAGLPGTDVPRQMAGRRPSVLTFAFPWALFLIPIAWLVRIVVPPRRTPRIAVRVPFGKRIEQAFQNESMVVRSSRNHRRLFVLSFIWLLVVFAIARPQWLEPPLTKELPTRDLLLLVDLSGSMQQEDFVDAAGSKIDRLNAVKEILGEFLLRRDGDRVGLVVFGDAPFLQAPFSADLGLSRRLLDETAIGMAGPRTALGDAIGLGITLYEQSDAPAKTIIALTDGNDTKSQVPPIEAARVAAERGIRIHTVAIGDPTTVGEDKLDEDALRSVASTTGGSYFFAADRLQLAGIYDTLDRIETRKVDVISHRPKQDLFYWPLILALALSMLDKAVAMLQANRMRPTDSKIRTVHVDPTTGTLTVREKYLENAGADYV